jgi:hypothetical protein
MYITESFIIPYNTAKFFDVALFTASDFETLKAILKACGRECVKTEVKHAISESSNRR